MAPNDPAPVKTVTLAPSGALIASALAGTPLAVLTVSLLNRTLFKASPLGVEESIAFGSIGAAVFGYLFHVAKVLIDRKVAEEPKI
jgi:hypothetical protein